MSPGDYCLLSEWDEKASAGAPSVDGAARAGPRGVRSDGDERALGLAPPTPRRIDRAGIFKYCVTAAGVAQLVRAFPCHGKGRRFKSGRSRSKKRTRKCESVLIILSTGFEHERGRENCSFPVEEGMGKPWVSQRFLSGRSRK